MSQQTLKNALGELVAIATERKLSSPKGSNEYESYATLIHILNEITDESKGQYKGRVTRFIIDSYVGDQSLGKKAVFFDSNFLK